MQETLLKEITEIQTLSNQRLHTPDLNSSLVTLPKAPALLRATSISNASCSSSPAIQFSPVPLSKPRGPTKASALSLYVELTSRRNNLISGTALSVDHSRAVVSNWEREVNPLESSHQTLLSRCPMGDLDHVHLLNKRGNRREITVAEYTVITGKQKRTKTKQWSSGFLLHSEFPPA